MTTQSDVRLIRSVMKRLHLSQRELAAKLFVSQGAISQMLAGGRTGDGRSKLSGLAREKLKSMLANAR